MKHLRSIGIMAVAVTSLWAATASGGSSATSSNSDSSTGGSTSTAPGGSTATAPGLGQPASDGKFTFTINTVKCGIPSVGDTSYGLGATAQGQFCDVNMTIANTSSENQTFSSSSQDAFSATGSKYSDSTKAEIVSGADQNIFSDINPGNSITTDIYYDIPSDSSIAKFELHDSPFSGGVTVDNK